ncbi:transmembrane protease serine 9 isoform X2 [Drosophila takahashii]|uniref:transmembrane protease serine 9 isoform X2 n=1 Tax=Drosophila takahashii TaxID=29030 RepID=UPI003899230C
MKDFYHFQRDFVLYLLLLTNVSTLFLDEDCGVVSQTRDRIMNGKPAAILDNPWMALIKTPKEFICAGTLINHRFVLSASHCLCDSLDCKKKHTALIVRLGEYDRSTDNESSDEDFNVIRFYEHKSFNITSHIGDIALLKLDRSVVYKPHIRPICIQLDIRYKPEADFISKYTAVGWGKTETGNLSDVLQTAEIYRLDKNTCLNFFWGVLSDSQICGGSHNGVDTCKGDSGGPLYSKVSDGVLGRQTQFGIVSFGALECGGLGVYTDVMSHADFIERIVLESDITVLLPKIDLLDEGCLDDPKLRSRAKSAADTFPWLAQVFMDSFLISFGALVSNKFVITTAQLIPENAPLKVLLGEFSESILHAYKVSSIHKHPEFESLTKNDVALLELEEKVDYTVLIKPICLPSLTNKAEQEKFQKKADRAQKLTAVGWGIRRSVMVQKVDSSECYQEDLQEIGDKQICMEHSISNIMSIGSGSPLVKRLPYGNSRAFTLVGLASFGRMEYHSRDVYTKVLSYIDWIGTLIKK